MNRIIKMILMVATTLYINQIIAVSQVTIMLDHWPSAAEYDTLYIAGSFNNWAAADPAFRMQKTREGKYALQFIPPIGHNEFKITRGSWGTCETDLEGQAIPNRIFQYDGQDQLIKIDVQSWDDYILEPLPSSGRSPNVYIMNDEFYIPQLNRYRRIWIYLPPDYLTSDLNYPVIYMMDGQNLFDPTTAFKNEWQVDEVLDRLYNEGIKYIVVGIENGGNNRNNEYCPYVNKEYGGGQGDLFADFIGLTLKPYIDANYRTAIEPEKNSIIGSSLGAYIALYTGIKYAIDFGNIGLFSPSFWFNNEIYNYTQENLVTFYGKIYFTAGLKESSNILAGTEAMYQLFKEGYLPEEKMRYEIIPNGDHKEIFWSAEFEKAIRFFDQP